MFEPKKIVVSSIVNFRQAKTFSNSININEEIYNNFWDLEFDLCSKIYDYNLIDDLIEDINSDKIDVLVTNYCLKNEKSKDLIKKIVRKTKVSLLIYPKNCEKVNAINFSFNIDKHNQKEIDYSYKIAKNLNIDKVNLINFYQVPLGYYKTGKSIEEFSKKIEENLEDEFNNIIRKYSDKKFIFNKKFINEKDISSALKKETDKESLLIIGDGGKNNLTSIIFGNEAQNILFNLETPVLVKRDQEKSFISSLIGIN